MWLASLIVMMSGVQQSEAFDESSLVPLASVTCSGQSPRLPATITLDRDLLPVVERMLRQSATFREQCRRLAGAPQLHVRVQIEPALLLCTCKARSVIQRTAAGRLAAVVEIGAFGNRVEWIAHEFEHLLEQVDGVRLRDLAGHAGGVWRISDDMFETDRAIRAGRAVFDELRARPRADRLVE
jgi:hypothetical protein